MAAKVASLALARTKRGKQAHLTIEELVELLQHEMNNNAFSTKTQALIVLYDPATERFHDFSAGLDRKGALDLLLTYCATSLRELIESE
jgi:hypothetical protein